MGLLTKVRFPEAPSIANLGESNDVGSTPTGIIENVGVSEAATASTVPVAFSGKGALVVVKKTGATALALELEKTDSPSIAKRIIPSLITKFFKDVFSSLMRMTSSPV